MRTPLVEPVGAPRPLPWMSASRLGRTHRTRHARVRTRGPGGRVPRSGTTRASWRAAGIRVGRPVRGVLPALPPPALVDSSTRDEGRASPPASRTSAQDPAGRPQGPRAGINGRPTPGTTGAFARAGVGSPDGIHSWTLESPPRPLVGAARAAHGGRASCARGGRG